VKAGEKKTWNGNIKYNQFVDEHKALKRTKRNGNRNRLHKKAASPKVGGS
jgi:hypothetical protein